MPHSTFLLRHLLKKDCLELHFQTYLWIIAIKNPCQYLICRKSSTIMDDSSTGLRFNFQYKTHILEFFFG